MTTGSDVDLMHMYLEHKSLARMIKFSSNIYHCAPTNLSLSQYIQVRQTICQQQHTKPCKECDALLSVANCIVKNGFMIMSKAFHEAFPGIKYTAEVARQRFLQMPLVCIVVGYQKSGQSLSYLIENYSDMNYQSIFQLLMTHKESSDPKQLLNKLSSFYENLSTDIFNERELQLIHQSYKAFQADEAQYSYIREQALRLLEGEIVTESDTGDPDVAYLERNAAMKKRIESLKRNAQRRIAKRIAEKQYLQRKSSRSVNSITSTYPDIGNTIEEFVKECNVGADAWRRTGMLTFDGNVKVKKRLHKVE